MFIREHREFFVSRCITTDSFGGFGPLLGVSVTEVQRASCGPKNMHRRDHETRNTDMMRLMVFLLNEIATIKGFFENASLANYFRLGSVIQKLLCTNARYRVSKVFMLLI